MLARGSFRFQSTLAIAGERARDAAGIDQEGARFQSTLAIAGERADIISSIDVLPGKFQSTLAIAGERAPVLPTVLLAIADVSIHARHCWRASQLYMFAGCRILRCFNPRSPLLASEPPCTRTVPTTPRLFQSTLAIAGERACLFTCRCHRVGVFQSTLAIAGERATVQRHCLGSILRFQSTLAIAGERALLGSGLGQ